MHPLRKASLGELNGVGVSRRSRSMSRDYENRGIVSSVLPGRKGSGFIATLYVNLILETCPQKDLANFPILVV